MAQTASPGAPPPAGHTAKPRAWPRLQEGVVGDPAWLVGAAEVMCSRGLQCPGHLPQPPGQWREGELPGGEKAGPRTPAQSRLPLPSSNLQDLREKCTCGVSGY